MTKRSDDVDHNLLEQARLITRAPTMQDTVNVGMQNTFDAELRLRHAHRIAGGRGTDVADDDVMSGAWR